MRTSKTLGDRIEASLRFFGKSREGQRGGNRKRSCAPEKEGKAKAWAMKRQRKGLVTGQKGQLGISTFNPPAPSDLQAAPRFRKNAGGKSKGMVEIPSFLRVIATDGFRKPEGLTAGSVQACGTQEARRSTDAARPKPRLQWL